MRNWILFLIVGLTFTACSSLGEKLNFNGNTVYHTKKVSKYDATKFGSFLTEIGAFNDTPKTVLLGNYNDTILVRFILSEKTAVTDIPTSEIELLQEFIPVISEKVFEGIPVEIQLCNNALQVKKEIK